ASRSGLSTNCSVSRLTTSPSRRMAFSRTGRALTCTRAAGSATLRMKPRSPPACVQVEQQAIGEIADAVAPLVERGQARAPGRAEAIADPRHDAARPAVEPPVVGVERGHDRIALDALVGDA